MKKNTNKANREQQSTSRNSKEKTSFDQNGIGSAPKYAKTGATPNESGEKKALALPVKFKNNTQLFGLYQIIECI